MSWVANVMLSVSRRDNVTAAEFSRWLEDDAPRRSAKFTGCGTLNLMSDAGWGGWKYPECKVWAGALNEADLDALLAHFREIEWQHPNVVQLFIMDQEESFFRLWMLRDGELRQYAPLKPIENDDDFWPPDA